MSLNRIGILVVSMSLSLLSVGCSKIETDALSKDEKSLSNGSPDSPDSQSAPSVQERLTLAPQDQKVDLLLIIDNSGSMAEDSMRLADKMEGFITSLQSMDIDWQMCLTTTTIENNKAAIRKWSGVSGVQQHILNHAESNLRTKILDTVNDMQFGGSGTSGDERGVAALALHFNQRTETGCYRQGAAFSAILISDEDERSVGGIDTGDSQYRALEAIDYPDNYIQRISGHLPRMTFNSLIIKPGDQACFDLQNSDSRSRGRYGSIYKELSVKTKGAVGSICSDDYALELGEFVQVIEQSLRRVRLQCVPVAGTLQVAVAPRTTEQWQLEGNELVISNLGPTTTTWDLKYRCP
jgi:hypothetical protein